MLSLLFIHQQASNRTKKKRHRNRRKNIGIGTITRKIAAGPPPPLRTTKFGGANSSARDDDGNATMRRSAPGALHFSSHHQPTTITVVEHSGAASRPQPQQRQQKLKPNRWSAIFGFGGRRPADDGQRANDNSGNRGEQRDEGGTEELLSAVQTLRSTSKMASKSAEAQLKGAEQLTKWAARTKNEAMADVVGRVGELMRMHAERQSAFAKDYEHYLKQLRKVAETERKMGEKCRAVDKLAEREKRLCKAVVQKGGGIELRAQLEAAKREREWAEMELAEERREAEYARMSHLASGLEGMADVQLQLARAGQAIFACQRELAEFVPKGASQVAGGELMQYEGTPHTRQRVAELRRSLAAGEIVLSYNAPSSVEQRRLQRRSDLPPATAQHHQRRLPSSTDRRRPLAPSQNPFGTPPPPYTPSAPPFELLDSSASRNRPNRHSTGAFLFSNNTNNDGDDTPNPNSPIVAAAPRIYPSLPPNPFAEELKLRRRQRMTVRQ